MTRASRTRRGFTLLEVLVALTVFTLVTLTIFAVFRAGIRSQNVGEREVNLIREARFAMDAIEQDFGMVFLRDETSYNVSISRLIERMESERLEAEETGDWTNFHAQYGDPSDPESVRNSTVGNPFEKGRIIDIQFEGKDSDDVDSVSMATLHPLVEGKAYRPLGLARVRYSVDKGVLIRAEEAVDSEKRNSIGELLVTPQPPLYTPLVSGVVEFNLSYSFWFDNQWYEVDTWNSANRRVRNANYILGDYRESREQEGELSGQQGREGARNNETPELIPGSAGWNEYINDQWNEPLDRLPATVRVRITLGDPEKKSRSVTLERVIRVYAAEETYSPGSQLTDDERENEQNLRDEKYRLIFPGVLDKF